MDDPQAPQEITLLPPPPPLPEPTKDEIQKHISLMTELENLTLEPKKKKIYNSTSTVIADHTLCEPNIDQVLFWFVSFPPCLLLGVT